MKHVAAILLSAGLIGCAAQKARIQTAPWDKSEIVGHRFKLVATDQVEVFSFQTDGNVAATIGTPDAVAGPLMSWHLDSGGVLIVKDEETEIKLQKLYLKSNTVEVLRNAQPATYKVTNEN
ncbi:hypothetical protein ACFLSJ_03435 [Verrucomicrobiota bacterium]